MELQIKKLSDNAIIPQYQHTTDSGMDLHYSGEFKVFTESGNIDNFGKVTLLPGDRALLSTGIAISLPPNTEAQVRPRSGLALKHGLTVVNSPGTIDEGYHGEIKIILLNTGFDKVTLEMGDRIAQLVIVPVLRPQIIQVAEFETVTDRGSNGFGSTGTGTGTGTATNVKADQVPFLGSQKFSVGLGDK